MTLPDRKKLTVAEYVERESAKVEAAIDARAAAGQNEIVRSICLAPPDTVLRHARDLGIAPDPDNWLVQLNFIIQKAQRLGRISELAELVEADRVD